MISLVSLSCLPLASGAVSKPVAELKSKLLELGKTITWKQCDEWNALNEEYGKLTSRKVKMSAEVRKACDEAREIHEQISMTVAGTTKSIEENDNELESVKGVVSLLKTLEQYKHDPEMGEEFTKAVQQSEGIAKGLDELKNLATEINELINSSSLVEEKLFELDNNLKPLVKKGLGISPEEEELVRKDVAELENVLKEWHSNPLEGLAPAYNGVLLSAKELLEQKAAQKPAEQPQSEAAPAAGPEAEAEDDDDEEEEEEEQDEEEEEDEDEEEEDERPQMNPVVKSMLPADIQLPSNVLPTRLRGTKTEKTYHNRQMRVN